MSLLLIGVVVVYLVVLVFALAMGGAAKHGDEQAREAFQRERQERKSRSDLGYWRGGHHS